MWTGQFRMKDNRRQRLSALATVLLGALAVLMTLGFMASPAKAQTTGGTTYPVIQPSAATTTTTTVAPTTTTTVAHHGLAFTGADITMTVGASAIALGAGGVLVLASRKRKAQQ